MSKKIFVGLCALLFLHFIYMAAPASAASLKISSFTFNQSDRQDIMGPAADMSPDGKPDASFSLSVSGASAITEISVETADGAKWSTNTPKAFIALVGSDGKTVNADGRLGVMPVLLAANYKLFVSDADKEITKKTTCTVTVKLIDGSTLTAKTEAVPSAAATATEPDAKERQEGIITAQGTGVSDYDLAGSGKSIGADGAKDDAVKVVFDFKNTSITGIKVEAQEGSARSVWDTLKGSGNPLIVVLDKNQNIVNKADGSVSVAINGEAEYILLLQDSSRIMAKSAASAKLTVSLADGRVFERTIEKPKVIVASTPLTVEFKGKGRYDFVGENESMGSNLNADRQIDANVNFTGTVSGIRIKSAAGKLWDTIPGNGNWLVAVTNANGDKLNKADGSVSIAVNGATTFSLWFEEAEASDGPFAVTFVLTNGQIIEATTVKEADKNARAIKFLSAKPAQSSVDLVGKNKKLAADKVKDHWLKVQVSGKGQIVAMTLKDSSGAGWDTLTANNGRWRLAVRDGSKTLNGTDGTVKINVDGTKELMLYAQNNGKLSAATGKLILEITWNGGEVTQNTLTW